MTEPFWQNKQKKCFFIIIIIYIYFFFLNFGFSLNETQTSSFLSSQKTKMPTLIPVPYEDMGWIQALPHLYQLPRGLTPSLRAASPSLREPRGLGTELNSSNEASSVFLTRLLSAQAIICRESHMASNDKHQHLSAISVLLRRKRSAPADSGFTSPLMRSHIHIW